SDGGLGGQDDGAFGEAVCDDTADEPEDDRGDGPGGRNDAESRGRARDLVGDVADGDLPHLPGESRRQHAEPEQAEERLAQRGEEPEAPGSPGLLGLLGRAREGWLILDATHAMTTPMTRISHRAGTSPTT